jgi:hypothetical protein
MLGLPPCRAALDAYGNPLGSLSTLSRLTALAELDVELCKLTGGALAGLRGFTGLRALVVSANSLRSLESLPTGGALTSLEARFCKLADLAPLADQRCVGPRNSVCREPGVCAPPEQYVPRARGVWAPEQCVPRGPGVCGDPRHSVCREAPGESRSKPRPRPRPRPAPLLHKSRDRQTY